MSEKQRRESALIRDIDQAKSEQDSRSDGRAIISSIHKRSPDVNRMCCYSIDLTPSASVGPNNGLAIPTTACGKSGSPAVPPYRPNAEGAVKLQLYGPKGRSRNQHRQDRMRFKQGKLASQREQSVYTQHDKLNHLRQITSLGAGRQAFYGLVVEVAGNVSHEGIQQARDELRKSPLAERSLSDDFSNEVVCCTDYLAIEKATPPLLHKREEWFRTGEIHGRKSEGVSKDVLRKARTFISDDGLFMVDNVGRTARRYSPNGWWWYWIGNLTGTLGNQYRQNLRNVKA